LSPQTPTDGDRMYASIFNVFGGIVIHRKMAGTLENSVQLNQCVQFYFF